MSRLIDKPIATPTLDAQNRPQSFCWAGQQLHIVEILDVWTMTWRWWEQEPDRIFWRVEIRGGGHYELWQEPATGRWGLYRIWD